MVSLEFVDNYVVCDGEDCEKNNYDSSVDEILTVVGRNFRIVADIFPFPLEFLDVDLDAPAIHGGFPDHSSGLARGGEKPLLALFPARRPGTHILLPRVYLFVLAGVDGGDLE